MGNQLTLEDLRPSTREGGGKKKRHKENFKPNTTERNDSGNSTATAPKVRLGEAARMQQLCEEQRHLPGSENYRPLVGGFAAAAYEAMKDLHYSTPEDERRSL